MEKNIVECPHGHHYNKNDFDSCPYCKTANMDNTFEWSETDPAGSTAVLNDGWYNSPSNQVQNLSEAPTQKTLVINEDNSRTIINPDSDDSEYQNQPVVGWLVCIEGPDKGKDFCLHGVKSTIGRRQDSSILLSDEKISRSGFPALIVYDDRKTHKFYLASGDASSHNNVELCGQMLLGQSIINPYDEITIENTKLVFVPFCGEDFYWQE